MENLRRKDVSGEKFPSPANPNQHQEFEFEIGFVTPQNSLAGQLFFNGRLLPHVFLSESANDVKIYSRSTSNVSRNDLLRSSRSNSTSGRSCKDLSRSSRSNSTSSRSSKDLSRSSRSNSTSSRSSSGRMSTSEACDSKVLLNQAKVASNKRVSREGHKVDRPLLNSQYGSQRWQYITQTPILNPQVLNRKKSKNTDEEELSAKKRADDHKAWFGHRFFKSFVLSCKRCHAMEPSDEKLYGVTR